MKLSDNLKILAGALTGLALALICGPLSTMLFGQPFELWNGVIGIAGELFVSGLKMIVIPLIFCSVTLGVCALRGEADAKRMGLATLLYFFLTTAFAVLLGFGFFALVQPGAEARELLTTAKATTIQQLSSLGFIETLLKGLLMNPFQAMAEGTKSLLAVISFALLLGAALNTLPENKGQHFRKVLEDGSDIMMTITSWIMAFAPLGVFALLYSMSTKLGQQGTVVFLALGKFTIMVMVAILVHAFFFMPLSYKLLTGRSPLAFFRGFREALMMAFSTASSSATLPVSLRCAEQNLHLPKRICGFVLPLGCTVNMNGTALYEGVCALFIAELYGIDLSLAQQALVVILSVLAAVGAPGIPMASLVTMVMVLSAVGLPPEGIAVLLPMDRLLDSFRTMANVLGDGMGASLIDHYFPQAKLDKGLSSAT